MAGLASLAADLTRLAPRWPLSGPQSGRRQLVWCTVPMQQMQAARSVPGATINDVYLASLAGALRAWYAQWGAAPPRRLWTLVPVSFRSPQELGALGNKLAAMRVPLPCGVRSAARRLAHVTRATHRAKRVDQPGGAALLIMAGRYLPSSLLRGVGELSFHHKLVNLMASNVPGPTNPLSLLGRPVRTVVPINFVPARHGVSVMLMSYRDHVCVGFSGDAELTGLDSLAHHWRSELDHLAGAPPVRRALAESRR